jgi:hypothetical protein
MPCERRTRRPRHAAGPLRAGPLPSSPHHHLARNPRPARSHSSRAKEQASAAMATVLPSPGAAGGADEELRIEMLGAGQEVGRSCCVLTYKGEQREEQSAAAAEQGGVSAAVRVDLGRRLWPCSGPMCRCGGRPAAGPCGSSVWLKRAAGELASEQQLTAHHRQDDCLRCWRSPSVPRHCGLAFPRRGECWSERRRSCC